ncbi:MAG: hypothetical protein ACRDJO_01080 [Actinomycetota bacterium]
MTERKAAGGLGPLELRTRVCHTDSCCPAIYGTGRGTLLVQGFVVCDDPALQGLGLLPGEAVVEVPPELLRAFTSPRP